MPAHRTVALGLVALLAFSAVAAAGAHGDHAHAKAPFQDDEPDDRPDEAGSQADEANETGPPEEAHFGLCTAWSHVKGNGQAAQAMPFQALTQALCEDVSHPGDGHDGADARPDHAGPPS